MRRTPGRAVIAPLVGQAPATTALAALCVVVFLLSPASGLGAAPGSEAELRTAQSAFFERWGVVPASLWSGGPGSWTTLPTSLFLHGDWVHLLGNTLFLLVFGRMVEERAGRLPFVCGYLAVGCAAMAGYAAANPDSADALVGASGAVSGVLGAFLRLFPRARVTGVYPFLFFLPLRLPAWIVLSFWVALQWLALRGDDGNGPEVAHLAHVLGFASGFLLAWARFRGGTRVSGPAQATEGEARQ